MRRKPRKLCLFYDFLARTPYTLPEQKTGPIKNGVKDIISRNRHWIGKKIVTKAIGAENYTAKEITNEYKFPERSDEERESWTRAQQFVGHNVASQRTKMQIELLSNADNRNLYVGMRITNTRAVQIGCLVAHLLY